MDKIKILVVDDHPIVLEGMQTVLLNIGYVEVTAFADHPLKVLDLIKTDKPDIVITDINMPEVSGIELTAKIKKEFPEIKIIAMSSFDDRLYISQMVQNGASGYILKNSSRKEIEEAILTVSDGKLFMSLNLDLNKHEYAEMSGIPLLSSREKEVLSLIAEGFTSAQIAEKLFVSFHTVEGHRKNLLAKLKASNTAGLIKLAAKYGLV
ncbi:MAG: response regulator transcription factor [Flavobacteriaceae bacterium]|jgi:DNA-binding NarL/FixJ family response regulator|nr:response regulator transcription factor [Flavobacteriaceae bacterium]